MMALEGASVGFQLGGQATDFVLLLMSPTSAANILKSKVKIGGDASAAAGPVGRNASAETDVTMRARSFPTRAHVGSSPGSPCPVPLCVLTTTATRSFTARM